MKGGRQTPRGESDRVVQQCLRTKAKLILMALNGIQLIVNFEVVPLSDVKSVLRVFTMQAGTGKPELQLKILQILVSFFPKYVIIL